MARNSENNEQLVLGGFINSETTEEDEDWNERQVAYKHIRDKKLFILIIVLGLIFSIFSAYIVLSHYQPEIIKSVRTKVSNLFTRWQTIKPQAPVKALSQPDMELLLKQKIDLARRVLNLITGINDSISAHNQAVNNFSSQIDKYLDAEKKQQWSGPVIEAHKEVTLASENYQHDSNLAMIRLKQVVALYNDLAQSIRKQTDLNEHNLPKEIDLKQFTPNT